MRLCVCVRPRNESHRGRIGTHTAIQRPDGSVWFSPNQRMPKGLASWDLLWVDPGVRAESQLRTFLAEDVPPAEVLIAGPCGALIPDLFPGYGLFAKEVLDPDRGPHWPRPTRAISFAAISRALGGMAQTGKFLTTAVPCVTPAHKLESGHGYGAVAVDQDSALLCRPCHELELGHAVLRIVLDPAETDLTEGASGSATAALEGARAVERSLFKVLAAL